MYENISVALKALGLETTNPELSKAINHNILPLLDEPSGLQEAIKILSEYVLRFEDANVFRKYLSNILLALVSTKIPLKPVFSNSNYGTCTDAEKSNHLEYSIALALLSEHPDVLQYALKYFEINPVAPFEAFIHHEDSYNVAPKKRRLLDFRQKITDYHIVQCCYTLLCKLPNEFASKWDWTIFVTNFTCHEDDEIRWMVKECMVILTNMTENQSKLLSASLNTVSQDTLHILTSNQHTEIQTTDSIIDDDLKECSVVNIDGIMLPLFDKTNVLGSNLVPVKSTVNNLRSLALAVASGKAVSLLGPVGSGKTCLVEHLAAITGRKGMDFKKVQLGDQTDSRMLLGSHHCTDVPGEFVWRPGVLTEAVQNGHWLLLEDIDSAALDVASTLSSLLERNALCVPGYRDSLPVTPGFQLFVTQRAVNTNYGFQKKISNSSTLLQKHLAQINVEPLSRSELAEIIYKLYPSLATICSRMIEVFMMFSVGSHDTSLQTTETVNPEKDPSITVMRGSRLISTRDLIKWCSRSVVGFDVSSPESALKVLQDAIDIFTCSIASPEHRLELAKKVGTCLGIVETKSEYYCKHHKPNVSLHPNALEAGRAKVARKEKTLESVDFDNKQVVFSFTRQSACLLERIACCVTSNEPVLLVGETGTGKTSSVQYLARQTGHKLVVINMNQQSDSADLLGGYKPVDLKYVICPIRNEFEQLFRNYYNVEKNKKFLSHIDTCYKSGSWEALLALMKQSHKSAISRLTSEKSEKKLKKWLAFGHKLVKLEQQVKAASKLTFAFIEGSLVKAMQNGHWVLLDEINLASAEILECLAGLLEDKSETIDLIEKGDKVPIKRHPDFTLFACMNPATDVGKKDLPVGLRNRFTEFFIDELTERNDLMLLIGDYLYHLNLSGPMLEGIYNFYSNVRKEAKLNLVDGAGNAPHYSLRTLCRALTAAARAKCGTVTRSLYEAFCLSFLTQLDSSSHPKVEAMVAKAVIGKKNISSVLNQLIPELQIPGKNYLLFEGHWIPQGKLDIAIPDGYILTPTVRKNLRDIARIVSLGRLPVLLQGDTSVGKTSLITYIAKASGNFCVRINNHEHTDLQEYIGSYATDASGKLVFKEGVLVEAMRKGHWIILDELNLAPSDVLEALNRVLDDNRELFIPETQQVVKADPNFMLFATQNPPGLYGGRKMLSRAFRNRFVELHFDEIPRKELEIILHQRCHIPPTYSKKMIAVMAELQIRRRGSAAVQGKDGFITLRDLFRWGQRYKLASKEILTDDKFYDWDQHIADEGYLVLAGKVRQADERGIIEEVIEKHIKRKVCPDNLFSLHQATSPVTKNILEVILNNQLQEFSHVVWTYNMRRLAVLIAKAFTFDEPVLLVGETGCGKTTICQVLATLRKTQLLSVNCHMHTESSDFLGGLRPVRQYKNDCRLFEWVDGPLINAMENGQMFLADEISLADDSVLERMNSLLEPERQLVLAERGMEDNSEIVVITAQKNFHFVGTMNPGGDFGKKELSPALRNRFTEIWCDSVSSREDLLSVLERSVNKGISLGNQEDGSTGIGNSILDFTDWLKNSEVTNKFPFSLRDLLAWVQFINVTVAKGLLDTPEAYVHGACMTFLDCFGTALTGHIESETLYVLRKTAIDFLLNQIQAIGNEYIESLREMLSNKRTKFTAESDEKKFGIRPFYIELGNKFSIADEEQKFTFAAPTTGSNTLRLLRGMQLNKAILLEGNPGVGKTSLVTALANSSGHKVVRINLSDQTDITDLFGTDLPSEDGSFIFKEGVFLTALQNGDWILLDELNLAPQPVLEGLNACLDHRGEVFIPELGKTFKVKAETKLFACQNPLKQGGARRGLPVSFLNRFTQVYIDTLTKEDLIYIVESQYPSLPKDILHRIVKFNCKIAYEITELQSWAHRGGPWEMNLRDIQRWCEALIEEQNNGNDQLPGKFVDMLYVNRMRTSEDKEKMIQSYDEFFSPEYPRSNSTPIFDATDRKIIIGDVAIDRNVEKNFKNRRAIETNLQVLRNQLPILKALAQSLKMNWLSILVGPTGTGKSSIVQVLADLTGNDLQVLPVTSAMDVSDLLGGFEQVDYNRNLETLFDQIETITIETVRNMWLTQPNKEWRLNKLLSQLSQYKALQCGANKNYEADMQKFYEKVKFLINHCEKLLECNKKYDATRNTIDEIVTKLNNLKTKVMKLTSVNAGGKFEWIDSLLVRSLINGSWLLLDNVNLTSAAVLDRLNGLLEPNGVLSIPEREEMSDIIPHPNFRVFFTMDPKYGEISRAMRNRGVEIYLLRSEDWDTSLTQTVSYMDLTALLSSCGLPSHYHEICLSCHELMTSFVQGLERPTISHLLQAAYLTWQQIVRGISHEMALITSFSDVYIKPRCGGDFASNVSTSLAEMKNTMLQAVKEKIVQQEYKVFASKDRNHTLTVKGLCSNSINEIAKQKAYTAVQQSSHKGANVALLTSIFTTYQRCTEQSIQILHAIIKESLQEKYSGNEDLSRQFNDTAIAAIKASKSHSESSKRFYPESQQLDEDEITQGNMQSVCLYDELWKTLNKNIIPENNFSALDYSKAVANGTLTDDFVEYPILKHCKKYTEIIDEYVGKVITHAQDRLYDETACEIIHILNWRNRFLKACSLPIFVTKKNKRTPILKEDIVPLLYMHSKWVQKHLMGQLFELLSPKHTLCERFERESKCMLYNEQDNTDIAKLSKKLRKVKGQPKLYENENEYESALARTDLYKNVTLDMNQPIEAQAQKLTLDASISTDFSLALDIPDSTALATIQENITKLLDASKNAKLGLEVKLLPVNGYIIERVLQMLKIHFIDLIYKLSQGDNIKAEKVQDFIVILVNLTNLVKVTKGFPPALLNLLQVIEKLCSGNQDVLTLRISSLPAKFWDEFYKSLVNSPALYPLPFLKVQSVNPEDELELIPTNTKRLSTNLPLLPYYVQKLTTVDSSGSRHLLAYETVALQDREEYSRLLGTLLNVVWKNVATMDTATFIKIKTDAIFEMRKYEQLMFFLQSIIFSKQSDKTYATLQDYLKDHPTLTEMIGETNKVFITLQQNVTQNRTISIEKTKTKVLTAELSMLTGLIMVKIMSEVSPVDHVEKYKLKVKYIEEDIEIFEALLSAYYVHGLISGTISENKQIEKASDVTVECYAKDSDKRRSLEKVHPYCSIILELREKTAARIHKYAEGNTFRPKEASYNGFAKDCRHFAKSVLSPKSIADLSSHLRRTCNELLVILQTNTPNKATMQQAQNVTKETASWLYSVNAFYKKIETTYSDAFPDLAKPLQSSVSEIIHSVISLSDLIRELVAKIEQGPILNDVLNDLMVYPNDIPREDEKAKFLNRFVTSRVMQLLSKNIIAANGDTFDVETECMEVLKMNLAEIKMYCTAAERADRMTVNSVMTTLNSIVKTWEKQQRDIEKKKLDDEALYVTKSKCDDVDEETEAYQEILQMFPSYSDNDFAEFKAPTLEQKKLKPTTDNKKPKHLISSEDVSLIYKWHSNFVRNLTSAEWLPTPKRMVGNNVISPLVQRYPIFSRVMSNAWEALDAEFEGAMTPGLMVLISQIKEKIDGIDSSNQKVDFYHSPWVSETRQCLPLLRRVKESTNSLLDRWPDFPTLKDIIIIVNRILGFPVTSPVSRFLTGLELLRDKIEEWNKNAHKGINMIEISLEVGQQIINWRKLEMGHWKECLNNLYHRKQSEAHKYWFYVYSVINSYLDEEASDPVPAERVIKVLRDFMETSNLAEYEVRLDILYVYHCHLVHFERSERRDELLSIFWNTHNYYAQFAPQVTAQIKEKRAPIEKKLRDFVKICSWDRDLSYWSVKDTVEKAHKALHKHTKEFENVLKESVALCLVDKSSDSLVEHVGIWDRPKRATGVNATGGAYMIDTQNFMIMARNIKAVAIATLMRFPHDGTVCERDSAMQVYSGVLHCGNRSETASVTTAISFFEVSREEKYLDQSEQPSAVIAEGSLLSKVPSLLNKAKLLCKETMGNASYPSLVQGLDDFVTVVIETSSHLGSLEVDATLPKDKQTPQAKNIVQQKRKAVADLFKALSKMGLNYRTGLVILAAAEQELYDFTIAPVDLDAAISYLKSRRCDTSLSLLWSGCEKYFHKNIARHRTLSAALLTPHEDLGIQNIERCKGFAAQLLKLTNTQKKSISKYSRHLCDLRTLTTNLTSVLDVDCSGVNITTLNDKLNILTECYANASVLLDQFSVLIKSCPEKELRPEYEPEFDAVLSKSPIVRCYKNSDEWHALYKKIKGVISIVDKQKTALYKLSNTMPKELGSDLGPLPVISQTHIDVTNEAKSNLESIIQELDSVLSEYNFKLQSTVITHEIPEHPILKSLANLSRYVKYIVQHLLTYDEPADVSMEDKARKQTDLINETEDLVATMLLVIQSLYKKHLPKDKQEIDVLNEIDEILENGEKEKEESNEILEDNHLKELLHDKLSSDAKSLKLEALITKMHTLLGNYVEFLSNTDQDVEKVRNAVMRLIPILEQTVLFVQYFVTQKVAVHRVSCKMLSVLLKIFSDLALKGFCKPSDMDMEDGEGEGGPGKLTGGTGLGDGEGQKDISERIENQDQLDEAQRPGEEKKEEERDCKEEEKGVNMTDDFDSHLQDVDQKEGDSDQDDDEDDPDKQMGDTDNAAEKLDQQIWGSDDEDIDEEQNDKKDKEEKGKGESTGEKEMGAKEEEQGQDDGAEGKQKKKKDINEMQEPEIDDDQVDQFHGNQQPLPEPEDFDLPDNMDVDGEEAGDDKEGETETENPFDIDVMKENIPEEPEEEHKERDNTGLEVSSDEEGDGTEDGEDGQNKEEKEDDQAPETGNNKDEDKETADNDQTDNPDTETEQDQPEQPEEKTEPEELPKNPDKIDEDDQVEEKKQEAKPQADPSTNDPAAGEKAENAEMERGTDDNVETNAEQKKDEDSAPFEQAQEQVGEDRQSTGRSELDKSDKGHRGEKQATSRAEQTREENKRKENKPGQTDQERTLGEVNEDKKKSRTLNVEREEETEDGAAEDDSGDKDADAFQHVKQTKKDDLQAIDAATKEQAEQQPTLQQEDEDAEALKEDDEVPMDVDDDDLEVEKSEELKSEKVKGLDKEKEKSGNKKEGVEDATGETGIEVEGEGVVTTTVPRGLETTYHTRLDDVTQHTDDMSLEEYMSIRSWLASGRAGGAGAQTAWRGLWRRSAGAAARLCERLRLVLEPTARSRRAGDFRTGRAINMRRVIPYIASHFRKDRIWLRRTKPARREYKIAIAVDDSSSMADNRSKELAFESLALVSQALNLLESGDLAVLSFGEKPNLLHPFTEQFSEHSGSKILEQLRFEQTKTKIGQLLDFCTVMFEEQSVRSDAPNAKLLVVVSDGRGIFSEGEPRVLQAVRRARQLGIFLVYVIIDNPDNKDSIMDIRRPLLDPTTNSLSGFVQYLDTFPFPFYLILRDISALPNVLGDALRQWFELAVNTS